MRRHRYLAYVENARHVSTDLAQLVPCCFGLLQSLCVFSTVTTQNVPNRMHTGSSAHLKTVPTASLLICMVVLPLLV
jgi:hypothetical protein